MASQSNNYLKYNIYNNMLLMAFLSLCAWRDQPATTLFS